MAGVGRRLRVMPCSNPVFSVGKLEYDNTAGMRERRGLEPTSVVAPGMAARLAVHFAPADLNNIDEQLIVATELGDYVLPLLARRVQPQLDFEEAVSCGCVLAGVEASATATVANLGGEGSFRLILPPSADASAVGACHYETEGDVTSLVAGAFRVTPATFYLEARGTVVLDVRFSATQVGEHSTCLLIEGDNGETAPLRLEAIADAMRLELSRWPSLPSAVGPRMPKAGESPWSVVPWMLNWLSPGTQVGYSASQQLVISNGGHLPMRVQWRLAAPPKELLSLLAVGALHRLSDDILAKVHQWPQYQQGTACEECPFTIEPESLTLEPWSQATFNFTYRAFPPAGRRSTVFAHLVVVDLPASPYALLHFDNLVDVQSRLPKDGYRRGLPLFGGAAGGATFFDRQHGQAGAQGSCLEAIGKASCSATAVCLQGFGAPPTVSFAPRVLALPGEPLPFIAHTQEVTLRNSGPMPACFRVRLSSGSSINKPPSSQLLVVGAHEVAPRPETPATEQASEEEGDMEKPVDGAAYPSQGLRAAAAHLAAQWPPLPPQGEENDALPGFGAAAVAVVEPHEGVVPPGSEVKVRVTFRAAREVDLDATLAVDLPVDLGSSGTVAPPLSVRLMAAVRGPRAELRGSSRLDYGVVRAHGRHTLKLRVDNPSDLPLLVRLRERGPGEDEGGTAGVPGNAASGIAAIAAKSGLTHCAFSGLGSLAAVFGAGLGGANGTPSRLASSVGPHRDGLFPLRSHAEVVALFTAAAQRGEFDPGGTSQNTGFEEVPVLDDVREGPFVQFVNARGGCFDVSGRQPRASGAKEHGGDEEPALIDDDADLIINPPCLALWPHQSVEVTVTLRTRHQTKYRAILEVVGFDSGHLQCVDVLAEVQLPRLRLSTQHAHLPITYLNATSDPLEVQVLNDSDMPGAFRWEVPSRPDAGLQVRLEPERGKVEARGSTGVQVFASPTREAHVDLICRLFIDDVLQPLELRVSAIGYGLQVDYAVIAEGADPPTIHQAPRVAETGAAPNDTPETWTVAVGKAPKAAPILDFGEMDLHQTRVLQLVLYNRTGIATQFGVSVAKHPAYDPALEAPVHGDARRQAQERVYTTTPMPHTSGQQTLDASHTRLAFANEPLPVAQGRTPDEGGPAALGVARAGARAETTLARSGGPTRRGSNARPKPSRSANGMGNTSRFEPKSRTSASRGRKFLLDDKHEKQVFRGTIGAEFAKQRTLNQQGAVALKAGRGYAVKVDLGEEWLRPFGTAKITLTCFSDLPGRMEDELLLSVAQLAGHADGAYFRIPMRVISNGLPLVLPDQQVGLSLQEDPPRLLCGTIVPSEKSVSRSFKVANKSAAPMRIAWQVYSQARVDNPMEGRQLLNIALCDRGSGEAVVDSDDEPPVEFKLWTGEPPDLPDPFAKNGSEDIPVRIEPEEAIVPVQGNASFNVTLTAGKPMPGAKGHYRYKLVGKGRFAEGWLGQPNIAAPISEADEVAALPDIRIEGQMGQEDDSDVEIVLPHAALDAKGASGAGPAVDAKSTACNKAAGTGADSLSAMIGAQQLAQEPDQDVITTIVLECVGDCILPRLTIDKALSPSIEEFPIPGGEEGASRDKCPVFKFTHSSVPVGEKQPPLTGPTLGGTRGGAQLPGVVSYMLRQITFSNLNACSIACRFRVDGPFRIAELSQPGRHPVRAPPAAASSDRTRKKPNRAETPSAAPDALAQLVTVLHRETVTLQVEFMPDMVPTSEWSDRKSEHVFRGDLVVEYPEELDPANSGVGDTHLQRVHLMATSRRPAVRLKVVSAVHDMPSKLERADHPPWAGPLPIVVDFGYVHVESTVTRRREVLLYNNSRVPARWQLVHVGRKRRAAHGIGNALAEDEDFRSLDDKDAFEFDVFQGELLGPSKDGPPIPKEQAPHWWHGDEHKYQAQRICIAFKPAKNELYKCRFRIQVAAGLSLDFLCRGCGSYDEEDDPMDLQEA